MVRVKSFACEKTPQQAPATRATGGWTRLLAHSVGDSAADQWLLRVRAFLDHCHDTGVSLDTLSTLPFLSAYCLGALLLSRQGGDTDAHLVYYTAVRQ